MTTKNKPPFCDEPVNPLTVGRIEFGAVEQHSMPSHKAPVHHAPICPCAACRAANAAGECPYCSGFPHLPSECPQVRAIDYYPDGGVKRVELVR